MSGLLLRAGARGQGAAGRGQGEPHGGVHLLSAVFPSLSAPCGHDGHGLGGPAGAVEGLPHAGAGDTAAPYGLRLVSIRYPEEVLRTVI